MQRAVTKLGKLAFPFSNVTLRLEPFNSALLVLYETYKRILKTIVAHCAVGART